MKNSPTDLYAKIQIQNSLITTCICSFLVNIPLIVRSKRLNCCSGWGFLAHRHLDLQCKCRVGFCVTIHNQFISASKVSAYRYLHTNWNSFTMCKAGIAKIVQVCGITITSPANFVRLFAYKVKLRSHRQPNEKLCHLQNYLRIARGLHESKSS